MEAAIYKHAQETPDAIAVEDETNSLSYTELVGEASHLAHELGDIQPEEPVGIVLANGMYQVVAQLAVRFAGGMCVPLEPSIPEERMRDLLGEAGVKAILVDESLSLDWPNWRLIPFRTPTGGKALDGEPPKGVKNPSERSHILFTSGSTGKPKPVQIRAEAILHLANKTPTTPLQKSDRVAEFNNPGFDLSLYEIWATLIAGATVVSIPRDTALSPGALAEMVSKHRLTVMIITTALFTITSTQDPAAFASLRHVITAGDVANVRAMRNVLKNGAPEHLWNAYGPTECATLATMQEVTLDETDRGRIGIGKAVGELEVVLLDEDQNPIHESGKQGEIHLGGPQLTPGYLNRPQENKERFLNLSREDLGLPGKGKVRLYKTGDLAQWREDNSGLDFFGRNDSQIKHQGFRVELGEIERALMCHDAVQSAFLIHQPPLDEGEEHSLVAFVSAQDLDKKQLLSYAREHLPHYMVPTDVQFLTEFPLTPNGKVDHQKQDQKQNKPETNGGMTNGEESHHKVDKLRGLWAHLLHLSEDVQDDDDLFLLGASSLQAASLIAQIKKEFDVLVSMHDLHRHSRFDQMVQLLQPSKPKDNKAPDHTVDWMKDVRLVDEIDMVPHWEAEGEGRVLVTGVTGFLGSHLLAQLMQRPGVKQIACLARSKGDVNAWTRVQQALERYDLWPNSFEMTRKILVLEGDLTDWHLGLGQEKFTWLSNWASVIFHLGAKINFCESYQEHRAANVLGTRNILHLAGTGRRKGFHYVSSIDVWGPTGNILGTEQVYEDEPLQPHIHALRYDLGYAQSQWTAEAMVRRMRDRGLPVTIYRPGFVVGHSETGAMNPDDFVTRLLVGCIKAGASPRLADQRLEYTTVDYVIDAMMAIATRNENLGRSYSLLSPDVTKSVNVEETCDVLNEAGYSVQLLDYNDWLAKVTDGSHDALLVPLMPLFQERVLGKLTRWEASCYSPVYRCDNTVEALRDHPEIKFRPFDASLVKKFIAFWERKGFHHISGEKA
ncbi:acetyl-CoA synthetase-like protein [Aspergillus homomorphus CBS 101889]|uniref:Acetyl-CoA synthetase-like protein n=1 Tax=Aspergillus homomorphus (strain CBS 101889) TaxID=1450537 RepID=A0A395HVF6_ASPHC|nr:acetyl-CoA synthetase-like protein [Aspergillus homomorphus CBS 101889]RAL11780.1 acetyl-CoA synthetase-like protein [Aspergillus homomorphus CBS 101889]